jgi:hypothetical protein
LRRPPPPVVQHYRRVGDEFGELIANARVEALTYSYSRGGPYPRTLAIANTNDRGEYRLFDVAAGKYYLRASKTVPRPAVTGRVHRDPIETEYGSSYYPDARRDPDAAPVVVAEGTEVSGIEIRIRRERVYNVRGKVIDGRNGGGIAKADIWVPVVGHVESRAEGVFDIRGFAPGVYHVGAAIQSDGWLFSPVREVVITDHDVNNVILRLEPALAIAGSVAAESGSRDGLSGVQVKLEPVDEIVGTANARVQEDGSFSIQNLAAHRYRLWLEHLRDGAYLKSVRCGDRDATGDALLDIAPGVQLTLVLGSDGGTVSGSARAATKGANVFVTLAPAGRLAERLDLVRTVEAEDGGFKVENVPPGEYKLFALESEDEKLPEYAGFRKLSGSPRDVRHRSVRRYAVREASRDSRCRGAGGQAKITMKLLPAFGLAVAAFAQSGTIPAASVSGRVINTVTGQPIAGTLVVLQGAEDGYVIDSDGDGRFRATDVVPGAYEARAEREGFTDLARGAVPSSKVRPKVTLQAGERREGLILKLIPMGAISGRVLDLDGDSLSKISVEAMGYSYAGGKKELKSFQRAQTNDHGEFRVSGLAPGRYFLQAATPWKSPLGSMNLLGPGVVGDVQPTYVPGSIEIEGAAPLDIAAGSEIKDRTIIMAPAQRHTLRITIAGQRREAKDLMFGVMEPGGMGMMHSASYGTTHTYPNSLPGNYFVIAEDKKLGISTQQWVKVSNHDVDMTITLARPVTISGLMWIEGGGKIALERASVVLESGGRRQSASVKSDGTFRISRLEPVVYDVHVMGIVGGYVKSVQLGEQTATNWQLDGARPAGALGVALATDGGRVEGVVADGSGAPVDGAVVVAAPDGSRRTWTELVRGATSKADGKFELRDLAPGDYRVFAFVDAEEGAPLDADFRQPFESQGAKVQVQANGRVTLRLAAVR